MLVSAVVSVGSFFLNQWIRHREMERNDEGEVTCLGMAMSAIEKVDVRTKKEIRTTRKSRLDEEDVRCKSDASSPETFGSNMPSLAITSYLTTRFCDGHEFKG